MKWKDVAFFIPRGIIKTNMIALLSPKSSSTHLIPCHFCARIRITGFRWFLPAWLALPGILLPGSEARSAEYLRSQNTAPTSVEQVETPLDAALSAEKAEGKGARIGSLNTSIQNQPAWLRDTTLGFKLRAYDFKRVNQSDSINEATTLGGELALVTGKFAGLVRVGLSYYYSGALQASDGRGNTGLLSNDQQNLSTLGKAYVLIGDESRLAARLYRQSLDLPFVNKKDSRMIPNTHEGYLLGRKSSKRDFVLGHITKMKKRNSEQFVPMSVVAGATNSNQGLSLAGLKGKFGNGTSLGAFNYYGWDTFNTTYVETNWLSPFLGKYSATSSIQYTDQHSVGDELLGNFATRSAGLTVSGGRDGRIFELAYTQTGKGGLIRRPWGGSPLYNTMMLQDFGRAGEKSLRLGVSLSGAKLGRKAWSSFANISGGWDAINASSGAALPNLIEYDLTLDYKPDEAFKSNGLWLRLRGAYADFDDGTARWNVRFIINYPVNIL